MVKLFVILLLANIAWKSPNLLQKREEGGGSNDEAFLKLSFKRQQENVVFFNISHSPSGTLFALYPK
jgi:hypothetical protein